MTAPKPPPSIFIAIHKAATLIMPVLLAVTGYFLSDVYAKFTKLENSVHELQLWQAETRGNRFSSQDWAAAKAILDAERVVNEQRVVRLEESIPPIRESLQRIEGKLERISRE
jgi:hypothetical protein